MAPKQKGQKMTISNFLADESLGSWADEMEDMPLPSGPSASSGFGARPAGGMGFGGNSFGGGSTFERETRGGYAVREPLALPTEPPYTAHVGNLSFEATADDISDLFAGCSVTNVRIVEDKLSKAPKGFGYVEFETLEGLQKALDLSGTTLQGRTIRTSVAEPPKESRPEGRDLDWTRRGPLPPAPERRIPERSSFGRNMDAASDAGSDRRNNFESDGKFRDFGNWERKGPLAAPSGPPPREGGRPHSNEGGPGSAYRRSSPAWGEGQGRSQDEGSRPPAPRPERTPTAADMDNQWRSKMRPDAPAKEATAPTSPTVPAARPKLNLAKRTVPDAAAAATASAGDSKASPFGAARPIDTAAREREVEEKHQQALRQKKEADDKAKAEKAEKAEKSEKPRQAKDNKEQYKDIRLTGTDSNKDDVDTPKGGANFEILRRAGGEESGMNADAEAEETPAPAAEAAETKETSNGNWRTAEPTEENDGWSTVAPTKRNNRRGGRGF
ncbi:hypothetical protein N7466_000262 [Penicillium verhagenii]|uniref:uncharacterized protein n=1 Tax=Penicillium verhagenii TaxID=1562060 RepID=UPI002545A911|nr:uncharacterized protein N7466_000262 [Penicillium verhagenii]KAJ5947247.1 hypothetical protein N7466_000262 [Penicillium verhagenii]